MKNPFGWVCAIICAICAVLTFILSFFVPGPGLPGAVRMGAIHFLIPVAIGWLAIFPRSRRELGDLLYGHPIAQRFFKGRPGGFFGDYRRKLTGFGKALLFGCVGLFLLLLLAGVVHVELFIIAFFYLTALSLWVIRLELGGDRIAARIRQIATALVYRPVPV